MAGDDYMKKALILAGAAAGTVAGLFGAGGGLVLVPLLALIAHIPEKELFPSSVAVMLPVCLISLAASVFSHGVLWRDALPFLPGSALGGLAASLWGKKIPVLWLHRILGVFILWGGIRYLW